MYVCMRSLELQGPNMYVAQILGDERMGSHVVSRCLRSGARDPGGLSCQWGRDQILEDKNTPLCTQDSGKTPGAS